MSKIKTKIKIEIDNTITDVIKLNSDLFITTIKESGIEFFKKYSITDDTIIEYLLYFDREDLLTQTLSENLVLYFFNIGYINEKTIKSLSMATYANFSENTITFFKEYLDVTKMLTIRVVTGTLDLDNMDFFVNDKTTPEMWNIISTCNLSKDFLIKNVKNINWLIYATTNCPSSDIREYFEDILSKYDRVIKPDVINKFQNAKFAEDLLEMNTVDFEEMFEKFKQNNNI